MTGTTMEFQRMAKKMTAKKKAPQTRNPNDATFRNIQALKRRLNRLELRVSELEEMRMTVPDVPVTPSADE